LFFNALSILIPNIVTEALLGLAWLWVLAEAVRGAVDVAVVVILHSEFIFQEIVEAKWGCALLFEETVEDIAILTCASLTVHSASLDLWLLVLFAEALLLLSVGWVTELKLIASDSTINLLGGKAIILHFKEVNNVSFEWAFLNTKVNGTLAHALLILISASLNWWRWLIAWIGRAEALFVMAVCGITVERVGVAKHVTV
jgi:hypothetical protein